MSKVPETWKRVMFHLVSWPPLQKFMLLGIQVTVPRHRVGVAVVPVDKQGRILMLYHVFHPYARWGLPGGWLGRREAPEVCALRELKEETGLSGLLGPVVYLSREVPPSRLNVAYLAAVTPGPMTLSGEIMEAEWFAPDHLPGPLLPFTRNAINAALQLKENGLG